MFIPQGGNIIDYYTKLRNKLKVEKIIYSVEKSKIKDQKDIEDFDKVTKERAFLYEDIKKLSKEDFLVKYGSNLSEELIKMIMISF